jgi:hypothetical protein
MLRSELRATRFAAESASGPSSVSRLITSSRRIRSIVSSSTITSATRRTSRRIALLTASEFVISAANM